jgi:hypothetical protein
MGLVDCPSDCVITPSRSWLRYSSTYSYAVQVYDAAKNYSDTQPPSTPTLTSAVASEPRAQASETSGLKPD